MRHATLATIALILAPARAVMADGVPASPASGAPIEATSPCGAPGRSWIKLERTDASFVDSFRTELASEGFDVCRDGGPTPPVATVSVTARDAASTIEVVDVVTSKRVSRDVDLRSIPRDGRPLALALAADELLRASWAELVMINAPPPAAPVPEPVQRAVDLSVRQAAPAPPVHSGAIGVMFAGEGFTGGQVQWGADARASYFATPRLAVTLRLGLRSALPKQTPEGEVRSSAVLGGIGAAYRVVGSRPIAFDVFARFDVAETAYAADTTIDARASSGSAVALLASAGGQLAWSVLPSLRLTGEIGATAPLRPVRATEAETSVVVGMSGVGALVGLGAGALF
jgi:hypothetical protein